MLYDNLPKQHISSGQKQFYDNLLLYCSVWNAFHKIIILKKRNAKIIIITRINTWIRFNHKLNIRQPM